MYESPFEGMLVKRTPWPATAAVVQDMGCSCSVCIRALVKQLENAAPSAATLPLPHFQSRTMEEPPALEPMSGRVVAPLSSNGASRVETVYPQLASFPSHPFFPYIEQVPPPPEGRFSGACNVS